MFFDSSNVFSTTQLNTIKLNKRKLFSGYRNFYIFKSNLPLRLRYKNLWYRNYSKAGRNCSGRVVVYTKSSLKIKSIKPRINHSFRRLEVGFISSFFTLVYNRSLISLFQNSSGSFTYLPTTVFSKLFILTRLKSLYSFKSQHSILSTYINLFENKSLINSSFFLVKHLPKNKLISYVELYPGKGSQYVRSPGSKAKIIKMDNRLNTAVIKLPSGVKKVFSIYSLGREGQVFFNENKSFFKNNKAGYYNKLGSKPIVRGVARNPVDHPHGGRTKAIRYPRTP